jgi:hypothetical protein
MATDAINTDLNAVNLKDALWKTLQDLRSGAMQPGQGDAIASQAREILRTVKTQLSVSMQATKRSVPVDVVVFSG